ncbi:MAG: nucleotidyltransferase family protein [Eubacterium sp.]|nr:nucleotidyltransferase family protein [Eubacterium sp.]
MKCFGVAAEFNPFHDGHSYLIKKAKEATGSECCIAAMSGDFTQRGEPAVFDKWERAKTAVECGADLVVEIPQVYACSSASYFAKGAVSVLKGLGVCDHIVFGSECGSTEKLIRTASFITSHSEQIDSMASDLVRHGISYPKAREQAVSQISGNDELSVYGPNDVLAVEYLKQDLGSMEPLAILRTGKGHFETASELRRALEEKDREGFDQRERAYFDLVSYRIAITPAEELETFAESENGLGNKVKKELRYASDLEALIDRVKSKAYTRTAITRLLTHILLGIRTSEIEDTAYARVLAMNDTGAEALRIAKKSELLSIPVVSNLTKDMEKLSDLQKRMISFDITAGDVYNIITGKNLYENSDHVKSPFKA